MRAIFILWDTWNGGEELRHHAHKDKRFARVLVFGSFA